LSSADDRAVACAALAMASDRADDLARLPLAQLVERAKGGDRAASDELFRRLTPDVLARVRRKMSGKLRASEQSVDIEQSVLGDLFDNLERVDFRSEAEFHALLEKYVVNKLREKNRRQGYGDRSPDRVVPVGPTDADDSLERGVDPADPGDSPSMFVAANERRERVLAFVAQLPERERRLVTLRDIEQRDWDEIVEMSGESTKKAAQQCHARAQARLAALMVDEDDEL
jgi:RNA polymerase sigma-70 factor (ECF subfamily)